MDCDNDHSDNPSDWLTPERLAQQLPDVAFAATYSRHHMQAKGTFIEIFLEILKTLDNRKIFVV